MTLEKLHIRGFQAHDDLTIEFDPAITTIQGPTDSGKSAILRALRWLVFNRPAGTAFRRNGCKSVTIDLRVDGKTITRHRGRSNVYKLDGQKFAAVAGGVPAEISGLLNLGDTNFAGQFDSPFWLSDTPGAVSRNLNAIVDLGIIDDTLAAVAGRLRKAAVAVEISRERLAVARSDRKRLAWVPEYLSKLGKLETQESEIAGKRLDCRILASLIAGVESAETTVRNAMTRQRAGQAAVVVGGWWELAAREAAELRELIDEIESAVGEANRTAAVAKQAAAEFKQETKGKACPLCGNRIR